MTPSFHAHLVNGRQGDPALYVDFRFERPALLFDLGDVHALAPRQLLRVEHIFVSHTHIDHFIGFDRFLRLALGRDKTVGLFGPVGIIDAVAAKLAGYAWNLAEGYATNLRFQVTEVLAEAEGRRATFQLKQRFRRMDEGPVGFADGVILAAGTYAARAAVLDHRIPVLGFALQETAHVNVWKNRLAALGLPVGPWLNDLKRAVVEGRADDTPIAVAGLGGDRQGERQLPLGELKRDVLRISPGQKIAYVTDVAYTPDNAGRIVALARHADLLFIEATFRRGNAALAAARAHLTTAQAGALAREAGVRRVEPFHFSTRYQGQAEAMRREVDDAFRAATPAATAGAG